jgi:hypothetical protein
MKELGKIISTSRGYEILVSEIDYEALSKWKWYVNSNGYAVREALIDGKRKTVFMHKVIMNTPNDLLTDHINGHKLNNQRSNLRICSKAQNRWNSKRSINAKNQYRGVSRLVQHKNKWQARLKVNGRAIYLGCFSDQKDAAIAYNAAAKLHFGEFAKLNPV